MVDKEEPNIFILLDLDPDKPWNQVEFERLLEEKRREWSRLVNRPDLIASQAKKNLGLIPKIKGIAKNETLRLAQAEDAKEERLMKKAESLKLLDANLGLLQAKGYILQQEFDQLLTSFRGVLLEIELRNRINVPLIKEKPKNQKRESLDVSRAKSISNKLSLLNFPTLYALLGSDENTESKILYKKADVIRKQKADSMDKSAENTLIAELMGECLAIFKNEEERAKYDESLRIAGFEDTKAKIDLAAQVTKEIDARQLDQILRDARQKGLDPEETLSVIKEYAVQKKYTIVIPAGLVEKYREIHRCGYCKQLNDAANDYCTTCGKSLRDPCPRCNNSVVSDAMACGSCGFPTGNRAFVSLLLDDAEQSGINFNYPLALEHLEQAHQAWPVDGKDPLSQKINELTEKMKRGFEIQKEAIDKIETAIRKKQFYTARELLPGLSKVCQQSSQLVSDHSRTIKEALSQTERLLSQARSIDQSTPEKVILGYQAVLAVCQDCQEARRILAQTPPSPPTNLQARVTGKLIQLTWSQSPSRNIQYSVVRKEGSRPVSIEDGSEICVVNSTNYDDTSAEIGISYFFTVFSNREGVYSRDGASLATPVMVVDDVENLCAQVLNHQISLSWINPPNVNEIIVVRSEKKYPTSNTDGIPITILDSNQAIDNKVQSEAEYFYTVFCQFKNISGQLVLSRGKSIKAIPQTPPEPIKEVKISASGGPDSRRLHFRWPRVLKGDVVLLKSPVSTGLIDDAIIPASELNRYGQILKANSENATDELNTLGLCYYQPVVIFQGMAYIGREHRFVSIDDISDLSVQNLGHALRLKWQWPQNCNEVIVAFSYSGWPEQEGKGGTTITLTRAQYDLNGFFDIHRPLVADHYIIVYAVIGQGEQRIVASGEYTGARKLVCLKSRILLEYEIKPSVLKKKFSLCLYIKGEGDLPKMVLIRKHGALPMNKSDGDLVLTLNAQKIQNDHFTFPIPENYNQRQSFARLFLQDDTLYDVVTIRHPALEKLRLF